MARAAFLDRDGVIVRDVGYAHCEEQLEFLPRAAEGLRTLQQAGYLLIVVTNQSGVARGLYTEAEYERFTVAMRAQLREQGVGLAGVYHCFHLEDALVARYATSCLCRKPRPGMLLQAMREHAIDPAESLMVGDRMSDMQAGRTAGVARCYLISDTSDAPRGQSEGPDAVFASLADCAQHVVSGF